MQESMELLHRQVRPAAAPAGLVEARGGTLTRVALARLFQNPILITVLGLFSILGLGWFGIERAQGVNLEFLYLVLIVLVGWKGGTVAALVCTLASASLLLASELIATDGHVSGLFFWFNSAVRLVAFAGIGWVAGVAGGRTRNLQSLVEQRTTGLKREVAQHKETSELLREAIQLLTQVTENIADIFWVTDTLKTEVEYVSPGFERVWGRTCKALRGSPGTWLEGIHHEDRERVTRAMLNKQIRGEYDEEYRVVRPDGSIRWVHDRAFPVKGADGAVYRLVGIAEDITERKRAEQLLQAQRDMGAALSSTSELAFAVDRLLEIAMQLEGVDCGGVYLMDSQTGELRLHAHRGLSGAFVERISWYKADAAEARLAKEGRNVYARHDQIPRNLEVMWGSEGLRALAMIPVRHKGEVLGLLNLGSYTKDEIPARTRLGIEMIASQVAGAIARIRAEDSLRRSEAHLRTIINSAPIALLAVDGQGMITFEDGQALVPMGLKPREHLHLPATEVFHDFPLMLDNIRRALAGEEFTSLLEFASASFECRFTPLPHKRGESAGFIAVAINITERARLQREVLEISDREQARIGQDIHDGLCQQLIGLGFKMTSLEQALGSRQVPESATAGKMHTMLDEAITESRRVCRGLYPIRLATQGLLPALEELAAAAAERHGIHCICESDGAPPHCDVATATHLYRIAQEAINNALKHSGAKNIVIHVGQANEGMVLSVKDDGKGMDLSVPQMSGMGLHIMDYRARLIRGVLDIRSNGQGTEVSCHVPQTLSAMF
jgi:PAS domain S-box-containing protein